MKGKVKWFDVKKGYGFILNEEGKDVFVHFSVIHAEGFRVLKDGEEVEYEASAGPKGLLATSVKRLGKPGKATTDDPMSDTAEQAVGVGTRVH